MTKDQAKNSLAIVWWNASDFFHFLPSKSQGGSRCRWPASRDQYKAKCAKVDKALGELFAEIGTPQVLALGEITHVAANDLRDRLLPEYRVLSLDVMKGDESLQVAVLYAPDSDLVNFEEQAPLLAPMMPGSTRPMAVLDATSGAHTVRMVICHWQARFDAVGSRRTRARTADFLAGECYDFIVADHQNHHLVIVGDFNEEPYEEGRNSWPRMENSSGCQIIFPSSLASSFEVTRGRFQ